MLHRFEMSPYISILNFDSHRLEILPYISILDYTGAKDCTTREMFTPRTISQLFHTTCAVFAVSNFPRKHVRIYPQLIKVLQLPRLIFLSVKRFCPRMLPYISILRLHRLEIFPYISILGYTVVQGRGIGARYL